MILPAYSSADGKESNVLYDKLHAQLLLHVNLLL